MAHSAHAVLPPSFFNNSSEDKVQFVSLSHIRSDKTLRNGVEQYGPDDSTASTLASDHAGLDETNLPEYKSQEIRRIVRKIDKRLPPVLAILYLLSYLDRSNIGNAKIAGMTKDLHMSGKQYNIALTAFFFPYAAFMVPSNIIIKKIRPSVWLSILMVTWGIVMTMHGLVESFGQLCALRALLGVFETGFMPAATYLLTAWYARYELQTRVAMFFSSASLASAFSGLLAYAIEKMDGIGGKAGWRWIFLLEGAATVLVGSTIWLILPDAPRTCKFLTNAERDAVERRLQQDSGTRDGHVEINDSFQWKVLRETVLDWRIWLWGIVVCGQSIPFYAFTFFAPTIIKELGYETWKAQLLVIPIWMAACISTLLVAVWADHRRRRWPFIVVPYSIAAVGFLAMLSIPHPQYPGVTYGFMFLIPVGLSTGLVAVLAWIGNNLAPTWRRSIGVALTGTLANLGGSIGSNIYLEEQAPRYWLGFGLSLGVLVTAIAATLFLKTKFERINRQRDAMSQVEIQVKYTSKDLDAMGDRGPLYRYVV